MLAGVVPCGGGGTLALVVDRGILLCSCCAAIVAPRRFTFGGIRVACNGAGAKAEAEASSIAQTTLILMAVRLCSALRDPAAGAGVGDSHE